MNAGKISASDFPRVPAQANDAVLGVQNGVVRLFPVGTVFSAANGFGFASGPTLDDYSGSVMYIAHRGNADLYPEGTMEAYRASYAGGGQVLEMDIRQLSGGELAVFHDSTIDRVTTGTGNVSALTPFEFKSLTIDAADWLGGNFDPMMRPALMSEVLEEFSNRAIFAIEAKNTSAMQDIIATLIANNIPHQQVILSTLDDINSLKLAVAAGYPAMLTTGSTSSLSLAQQEGIEYICLPESAPDLTFTTYVGAGFKVGAFTPARRAARDRLLALGCTFFYSDDVPYLSRNTPYAKQDTWERQRWMPGQIDQQLGKGAVTRGRFYAPNYWGWDDTGERYQLQGWACPIKGNAAANDYTIDLSVRFDAFVNSSQWAGIYLTDTDMRYVDGVLTADESPGYNLLIRASGQLQIYKLDPGSAGTQLAVATGAAIAEGQEVHVRVRVTPTHISIHRLDGPSGEVVTTATIADTTYRGGYFHLGHKGAATKFRNVIVS